MTEERQADHSKPTEETGNNQITRLVAAAQECEGPADAEPPRTLDGHPWRDYLTPDGS